MSKIAFTPNASGSGVLTVASPNTNSDYTLTLPESTSTVLTDGSQNYVSIFRTTSDLVPSSGGSQQTLTAWEAVDSRGQGNKGTGVSQSSGVFSFANTGYYLVTYNIFMVQNTVTYAGGVLQATLNNSDYNVVLETYSATTSTSGSYYKNAGGSVIFDVTDTSNCKVKTNILASHTNVTFGSNTDANYTHIVFQRVGDT